MLTGCKQLCGSDAPIDIENPSTGQWFFAMPLGSSEDVGLPPGVLNIVEGGLDGMESYMRRQFAWIYRT